MQTSTRSTAGRARLAIIAAAALGSAALPAAGLLAGPASAAGNPDCTLAGTTVTCAFAYNGSTSTNGTAISWPVPAGVTTLTVTADGASGSAGASGGSPSGGSGGAGGEYEAQLTGVPDGTVLSVFPGGQGSGSTGGVNAGGSGGSGTTDISSNTSGGGGGASSVAVSPFTHASLLLVAGGGGGGSAENLDPAAPGDGGAGGTSASADGADGQPAAQSPGGGGTTSGGGAAGTYGGTTCLTPSAGGASLAGGSSGSDGCTLASGGGGGGYFGGGGGEDASGGGGGSAYPATPTTVDNIEVTPVSDAGTNTGNGSVTITYTQARTELTRVSATKEPGNSLLATATLTASGDPVAGELVTFTAGPYFLCTATTNSNGVARCLDPNARQVLGSLQKIVTATFHGDTSYYPSTGLGQIIRFA